MMMKNLLIVFLGLSGMLLHASEQTVRQGFIKVSGEELYYQQFGLPTKEKLPIIVLHGGPGMDQSYLLPQMLELAKDREVIFYDQRSSGKSSTHPFDPGKITMKRFVDDLEAVRKHFRFQKMILLGHSWGGVLAAEYAINYPSHVAGLIILDSVPMTLSGMKVFDQKCVHQLSAIQPVLDKLKHSEAFQQGDPKTVEQWYRIVFETYCVKKSDAQKITLDFSEATALNGPKIEKIFGESFYSHPYDLRPELHRLTIPVLIIHGAQDPVPVKTAEESHQAFTNSKLVILNPCGHFPYVEQPKKCFKAMRNFLKKL